MEFLELVSINNTKKRQIIRASTCVLVGHLTSQLIRLGGNLVLTRLLVPEMFGVMAIVNVLVTGMQMLSDLGLGQSIIQSRKGDEPGFINTAWTLQIIRGGFLWIIICLLSFILWAVNYFNYLAKDQVYAHPLLPWLMITVGFGAVISGFNSMSIFQVNRNLMLGRLTLINLVGQIASLFVIIIISWVFKTIWALAIGSLVSQIIEMIFSHKLLPGIKNKLYWDKSALAELLHFGKWIFLSSAIGFIANQGDRLILGGLMTVEELGVYSIAFMLSNLPSTIVSTLSHKVLFPSFSRINRESPDKLKYTLSKSKLWLSILFMPVTGFMMSWSEFVVDFLYDDRYFSAGWMMSLLLFRVATGCILIPNSLVMVAKGMPQYSTISAAQKAIFLFLALPFIFNQYGVEKMVLAIGLSGLIDVPVLWFALIKYKLFSIRVEIFSIFILLIGYVVGLNSMKIFAV